MHFRCTQCPAEFCSGCGGLFKQVLAKAKYGKLHIKCVLCNLSNKWQVL